MYVINEYQTTNGTTAIVTPATAQTLNEAESIFHSRCASAAISTVETHSITLETDEGFQLKRESFKHTVEETE